MIHSSSVFHVATVVALAPEQELLSGVRGFVKVSEDSGAKVVYAGVEYFAEMIQSEFLTGIVGDKQLGDSLSSPSLFPSCRICSRCRG